MGLRNRRVVASYLYAKSERILYIIVGRVLYEGRIGRGDIDDRLYAYYQWESSWLG